MAYFISRRFMLFLNRFTVLVRVLRRWQGKMKPWSLDSRTVDVLKLIEKMVFTPHDIAIEPWFLRQEGKHASDVHVGLNSYWTSTVRAFAPRPVEWGWSAGPERFSQVWTRMAAVAAAFQFAFLMSCLLNTAGATGARITRSIRPASARTRRAKTESV